jgi:uncharacterized protein (TIGR02598 family)
MPGRLNQSINRGGFSLIEVVIAAGVCTFALFVIASLLPVGLGTVQSANRQIVETEVFNRIWSEVNTTPFTDLSSSATPFSSPLYFNVEGEELASTGQVPPVGAIYIVRCSLLNATTSATLGSTSPPIDGSNTTGAGLTLAQVQIGYHVDPKTLSNPANDSRVDMRSFLLAKRDGD